jgi:sirohydrochlorin ferrochelatase
MSTVLDFPDRRAQLARPAILEHLEHMDDTVEIALDRLARGDRPADVLAGVYRTASARAHGVEYDDEPTVPLATVLAPRFPLKDGA